MLYAQVGQHHPARTTETSPKRSSGTLSCLSARPPDLATVTAAQPEVACVRPSIVPFVYSKRAAAARSPGSRYRRSIVLSGFRANQPWNYPIAVLGGLERLGLGGHRIHMYFTHFSYYISDTTVPISANSPSTLNATTSTQPRYHQY